MKGDKSIFQHCRAATAHSKTRIQLLRNRPPQSMHLACSRPDGRQPQENSPVSEVDRSVATDPKLPFIESRSGRSQVPVAGLPLPFTHCTWKLASGDAAAMKKLFTGKGRMLNGAQAFDLLAGEASPLGVYLSSVNEPKLSRPTLKPLSRR